MYYAYILNRGKEVVNSLKLLLAITLLVLAAMASQAHGKPEQIIIDTTETIKQYINETSQKLTEIIDNITHTGKMSLFKTMRASRQSKKKIKNTISQVECELNKANQKIKNIMGFKQPTIKIKTDNLLAEATHKIFNTHKKIEHKLRKALKYKKKEEIVLQAAKSSKRKIRKFRTELTAKIENAGREIKTELFNSKKQKIL